MMKIRSGGDTGQSGNWLFAGGQKSLQYLTDLSCNSQALYQFQVRKETYMKRFLFFYALSCFFHATIDIAFTSGAATKEISVYTGVLATLWGWPC